MKSLFQQIFFLQDKQSYAYSFGDYEDFESDTETPRKEKSDKSKGYDMLFRMIPC